MLFSKTAILTAAAAFSSLVQAQSSQVHVIKVGQAPDRLKFNPEKLTAAVGDLVKFDFYPGRHSVARSTFDSPCQAIADDFYSGLVNGANPPASPADSFTIRIKDDSPIWYFCPTSDHCQEGMSGVINPPQDQTLEQYKQDSVGTTTTVDGQPRGGVEQGGTSNSTSTKTASGEEPSGTTSTNNSKTNTSKSSAAPEPTPSAASAIVTTVANIVFGAAVMVAFLLV